ncbi:MAG: SGNH/GDSL hydrolase family protein [Kiritimatiellae bacterium]|nr:SGNH/GDSL hydrolase family protein [Kiritimatiellia bacterium]MDD5522761.1 SGNH/GDSL hydrolase family protein [Kiritimatiellia bacterium]
MKTLRTLIVVLFTAIVPLFAQQTNTPVAVPEFKPILSGIELKDGDTMVFLGDSITHQCLYTQYIEDYYYTRYPDRRICFHNSGIGGDRAADALARFDDDVAAFKPKYVTILLGMNDGSYTNFVPQIFETYEKGMIELLDKIAAIGALAIPMTPTMHDSRAARMRKPAEPRDTYYNSVLAFYGTWLREIASQRGLGFVNMWTPLNDLTMTQRKKDPNFTLIPDAVHPSPTGQVVMATAIINDMIPRSTVSQIIVRQQPKTGKFTVTGINGKAADLQAGDDKISFTFKANALPWVLPPDAADGCKLTHLGHRYSNEKITVGNLKPGKYELRIDGELVGAFTEGQLAFGVELEGNEKTPQYQQALKVAMLNKERNEKAVKALRGHWLKLKMMRREIQKLESGTDKDAAAAKRAEFEKWLPEFKPGVAEKLAQIKQYEDQIYAANKPVMRKYELTRMP